MKKFALRVLGGVAVTGIAYWGLIASMNVERSLAWSRIREQGAPTRVSEFRGQPGYATSNNGASFYNAACVMASTADVSPETRQQKRAALLALMHEGGQQKRCVYRLSRDGYCWGELDGYQKLLRVLSSEMRTRADQGDREGARQIAQDALKFAASFKQLRATPGHAAMLEAVEQIRRCTDDLGLSGEFASEWKQLAVDLKKDQLDALQEERVIGDQWLEEYKPCTLGFMTEESTIGLCRKQLDYLETSSRMVEATVSGDIYSMRRTARDIDSSSGPKNLSYWPVLWERSERLVASLDPR